MRDHQDSRYPSQSYSCGSITSNLTEQCWFIGLTLLLLSSSATFRYRDVDDLWGGSAIDGQVLYHLCIWLILGVVAIYCVLTKKANLSLLSSGPLLWFYCYAVCATVSAIYSIGPALTVFRSYQLFVGLILVVSVKSYPRCLLLFVGIWIAINWILVLIGFFGLDGGVSWIRGPDDAFISYTGTEIEAWRFASAIGHPANISIVTAITVIGIAGTISRQDWRSKGAMMVWLAMTNVLTVGRVGFAAMIIGLVIVAIGRRVFFPITCVIFIISLLVFMSSNVDEKLLGYFGRGQSTEELESFSGRTGIYERALELIEKAPIYGYGYRSGRMQVYNEASSTIHAHNAFLESYVGLGIIGLLLMVTMLLSALWRALRMLIDHRCNRVWRYFGTQYLALLVPIFTFSMSETGLAGELGVPQLYFLAVFASYQTIWQSFLKSADPPFSMISVWK